MKHLCRVLRATGAEVFIATPESGTGTAGGHFGEEFPLFRYSLPTRLSTAEVQGTAPARGVEALHRWMADLRPDVVHFHNFGLGMGVTELRAARAAGARTVLTLHLPSLGLTCLRTSMMRWGTQPCDGVAEPIGCAVCCWTARGVPRFAARPLAHAATWIGRSGPPLPGAVGRVIALPQAVSARMDRMREAFALSDRIVALADWAREVLIANGAPAEKVVLNRVGCSLPAASTARDDQPGERPLRIGFVGRLHGEKGAHHLLGAVRRLPKTAPFTVELVVSVNGEEEQREMAALQSLQQKDVRIHILCNAKREQVAGAMAAWDVVCCPSTQFELGPMVVLEAFSRGVPVIASDLPNMNHLIADRVNGRLFPVGDEAALAAILAEVVASPEQTVLRWRRAIPPVRTMDEVAADYLRLYADLCQTSTTAHA